MTVHQPSAWVVGFERDNQVPRSWEHSGVSARRVGQRQANVTAVRARTLRQDEEFVAVEMNRMGDGGGRLDGDVSPLLVFDLDHGDGCLEGGFVIVYLHRRRVVPLGHHGSRVQVPSEETVIVETNSCNLLFISSSLTDYYGMVRDKRRGFQIFTTTSVVVS